MKRGGRRARRSRRVERGCGQRAAGVRDRLAGVEADACRDLRNGVVRHRDEDEIDVVDQLLATLDGAGGRHQPDEVGTPTGVARRDPRHRPSGTTERNAERGPRVSGPDDADSRQAAGILGRMRVPMAEHPLDRVVMVGRLVVVVVCGRRRRGRAARRSRASPVIVASGRTAWSGGARGVLRDPPPRRVSVCEPILRPQRPPAKACGKWPQSTFGTGISPCCGGNPVPDGRYASRLCPTSITGRSDSGPLVLDGRWHAHGLRRQPRQRSRRRGVYSADIQNTPTRGGHTRQVPTRPAAAGMEARPR